MDNFKEASRVQLRFTTLKGSLTVEQLWSLSLQELDTLAVALQDNYNNSKSKSFLDKKTEKNATIKLQFDIVLDILQTKVDEANALQKAREDKEHNQKILGLIADKQEDGLKKKSIKELEAMLH